MSPSFVVFIRATHGVGADMVQSMAGRIPGSGWDVPTLGPTLGPTLVPVLGPARGRSAFSALLSTLLASLGLLAVSATPARAEVMEVGSDGWHWVTGPATRPAAAPAAMPGDDLQSAVPPQWRAIVARLSERYDLSPAIIEALVWQESRWHPQALSHAGARGLAQLMPGTARQLGANPNDPESNIEGGARYLRQLLDGFGGDLERALAAYNAGPERVVRADGVPHIAETQHYVTAIFARLSSGGK